MEKDSKNQLLLDLTLSLAFLCSWEEKGIEGEMIHRAWKGYDFGVLDKLMEAGLIDFSYKAKSLCFTEEGLKKAQEIIARFDEAGR
ncbi:MAG: DUF6429 family protein [Bacteroidales bacterium]